VVKRANESAAATRSPEAILRAGVDNIEGFMSVLLGSLWMPAPGVGERDEGRGPPSRMLYAVDMSEM
jgi:hypothetical protein